MLQRFNFSELFTCLVKRDRVSVSWKESLWSLWPGAGIPVFKPKVFARHVPVGEDVPAAGWCLTGLPLVFGCVLRPFSFPLPPQQSFSSTVSFTCIVSLRLAVCKTGMGDTNITNKRFIWYHFFHSINTFSSTSILITNTEISFGEMQTCLD